MAESLVGALSVDRDVVSVVGAGGKTTLVFGLARELEALGRMVVVTTTTKMGSDQTGGFEVAGPDLNEVRAALERERGCIVFESISGHKAVGVEPGWVDEAWTQGIADAIVVEADGARRRKVKAPAPHEPVIPIVTTVVVAMMSAAALGGVIADVAHRPELVAAVVGAEPGDTFTPEHAATLLTSVRGARKGVPSAARYFVAMTNSTGEHRAAAERVRDMLAPIPTVLLEGPGATSIGR